MPRSTACGARRRISAFQGDTLTDVVLIGLPTAIIGARLYYVFCHWSNYVGDTVWQTLWNWCKIWEGGTAIPGGLLLATFCVWLYARKKKIPFGAIMDCVVLGLLIGQIIGRWSNFMNREVHRRGDGHLLPHGAHDRRHDVLCPPAVPV